jgi:ComF family protein
MKIRGSLAAALARRRLQRLIDLLLPRCCLLCGLASGSGNLCGLCREDLPRPRHPCRRCALPLATGADTVCGACLRRPPAWDSAIAGLNYAFPVDHLVCRFKFNRSLAAGDVLGHELLGEIERRASGLPQALVPVPLHWARQLRRQFNQAEVLARQIARPLGLPVLTRLLLRSRHTRAQSGLDAKDRRRNLAGAFTVSNLSANPPPWTDVALVDDVCTTGATLEAGALALRKAGIRRVSVWVASRAPP